MPNRGQTHSLCPKFLKMLKLLAVALIIFNVCSSQVGFSDSYIMSSCVKPLTQSNETNPLVLLHSFDRFISLMNLFHLEYTLVLWLFWVIWIHRVVCPSSCLEWRRAYPLLENAGLEAWAVDILGWGFSDLGI